MDISKKLKDVREEKSLTIEELAEKAGRDIETITGWENGSIVPSASDLIDLSRIYGLTMDEMIYNDATAPEYNADSGSYGKIGSRDKNDSNEKNGGFTVSEKVTLLIFPFLCVLVFFVLGITMDLWHPGWIVFTIIPVYYILVLILRHVGNDAEDAVEEFMDESK